jgi:hypothetical protein
MPAPFPTHRPLLGLGMTSVVLGTIGMFLFFLPILGIPLSAFGLLFGVIGFFVALPQWGVSVRWSLGGIAMSALALAINVAIAYAPEGYLPGRKVPQLWRPDYDSPYVAPPAPPR